MNPSFIIETNSKIAEFQDHLNIEDNHRIILSGQFGSGKTTFLRKFFSEDNSYLAIHLFPVNYSVAQNEDIFELIKFDILYELLSYNIKEENISASTFETIAFLSPQEQFEILKKIIKAIPKIGKPLSNIIEALSEVKDLIKSKKEQLSKDSTFDAIEEFITNLEDKKGSIRENDSITQLIVKLVNDLKGNLITNQNLENIEAEKDTINQKKNVKKKSVLVIDDLDRLDPEHIFRILNIFSAHIDIDSNSNKFNFDKIIFSLDLQNIERIYAHKFGEKVDFTGYISKFFSLDIFQFGLINQTSKMIDKIIGSIQHENKTGWNSFMEQSDSFSRIQLKYFLYSAHNSNVLSLRDLLKVKTKKFTLIVRRFFYKGATYENINIRSILFFEFLERVFDTKANTKRILSNSDFQVDLPRLVSIERSEIVDFFESLIILYDFKRIFGSGNPNDKSFQLTLNNVGFDYRVFRNANTINKYQVSIIEKGNMHDLIKLIDLNQIINVSFDNYYEIKWLDD